MAKLKRTTISGAKKAAKKAPVAAIMHSLNHWQALAAVTVNEFMAMGGEEISASYCAMCQLYTKLQDGAFLCGNCPLYSSFSGSISEEYYNNFSFRCCEGTWFLARQSFDLGRYDLFIVAASEIADFIEAKLNEELAREKS